MRLSRRIKILMPFLYKEIEKLELLLKWAIHYIEDSTIINDNGVPKHNCDYILNPEEGYCEFCDKYWEIKDKINELTEEGK